LKGTLPFSRTSSRNVGFTMLEILLAIVILSIGILSLLALFPLGMVSLKRSIDRTRAAIIARSARSLLEAENAAKEILDHPEANAGGRGRLGFTGPWFYPDDAGLVFTNASSMLSPDAIASDAAGAFVRSADFGQFSWEAVIRPAYPQAFIDAGSPASPIHYPQYWPPLNFFRQAGPPPLKLRRWADERLLFRFYDSKFGLYGHLLENVNRSVLPFNLLLFNSPSDLTGSGSPFSPGGPYPYRTLAPGDTEQFQFVGDFGIDPWGGVVPNQIFSVNPNPDDPSTRVLRGDYVLPDPTSAVTPDFFEVTLVQPWTLNVSPNITTTATNVPFIVVPRVFDATVGSSVGSNVITGVNFRTIGGHTYPKPGDYVRAIGPSRSSYFYRIANTDPASGTITLTSNVHDVAGTRFEFGTPIDFMDTFFDVQIAVFRNRKVISGGNAIFTDGSATVQANIPAAFPGTLQEGDYIRTRSDRVWYRVKQISSDRTSLTLESPFRVSPYLSAAPADYEFTDSIVRLFTTTIGSR